VRAFGAAGMRAAKAGNICAHGRGCHRGLGIRTGYDKGWRIEDQQRSAADDPATRRRGERQMGLLPDIDDVDRRFMLEEFSRDMTEGRIYPSPRLSPTGTADFPGLLREAVAEHDDNWLAEQLNSGGRLRTRETSQRKGVPYQKAVPWNAADTLAEGEFNRLYIRGQCLRALHEGAAKVEIFRAKAVTDPRPDSEFRIGVLVDASQLLDDIRNHVGIDTALKVPGGPNSGISARLSKAAQG